MTYGDENVTIQEGDTTYNVYYLVEDTGPPREGRGFLDSLAQTITGTLASVLETVFSIFDSVPSLFGGFLAFLSAVFPFLPPEIMTLLTFRYRADIIKRPSYCKSDVFTGTCTFLQICLSYVIIKDTIKFLGFQYLHRKFYDTKGLAGRYTLLQHHIIIGVWLCMVYVAHDKLPVITLEKEQDVISLEALKEFLRERPASVVYVELDGHLYGLFSMGSVRRAMASGRNEVRIRRNFTRIAPGEYMRALQIFHDKHSVNAIPVVTPDDILLGEYSRWDDSIVLAWQSPYSVPMLNSEYAREFWVNRPAIMIKPHTSFDWKVKQFEYWKKYFEHMGVAVTVVEWAEVFDHFETIKGNFILCVDPEELHVIQTFEKTVLQTYADYVNCCGGFLHIRNAIGAEVEHDFLKDLQDKGVHVLNLTFGSTSYYARLTRREIEDKFEAIGKKPSGTLECELYPDFFADLYSPEYAAAITYLQFETMLTGGTYKLKDIQSPFLTVENNERKTVGQPKVFSQEIFFAGPCCIYGHYVEDMYTIESLLQKELNELNLSVCVRNLGAPGNLKTSYLGRTAEMSLHKNDIVVVYMDNENIEGIPNLDLVDVLEKNKVSVNWMVDNVAHVNHIINKLYAEAIYEKLAGHFPKEGETKIERESVSVNRSMLAQIYLKRFFSDFDKKNKGRIGSIVMNCNPFTKGHRYLIEQALKRVDFLIIFVVEEDKSLFPFDMRFAFVKAGTEDLKNVMVVPSGSFILSQTTFPEYFIKIKDEDIIQNAEYDITVFAEQIAPYLNITCRFVGEEPEDGVTREYNNAMKRILPANGIELIEIPRLELENGRVVSATAVRQCLEDGDMEMLDRLVPESTKKILFWENN